MSAVGNLGPSSSQFSYTPNRARWKQVANYAGTTETTVYIGGILEKMTRGSVTEYRHNIPSGPGSTVVHTRRTDATASTYYTVADHLGSGAVTMDSSGAALVKLSFAAYGKRRGAAWNDVPLTADWTQITAIGRDGFTGVAVKDFLDSGLMITGCLTRRVSLGSRHGSRRTHAVLALAA